MKKILIASILVILFSQNILGQCSNPDCGEDLDVCGQTADLTVISATTGFWSAYLDGTPATVSFIPDNTSTSVEITIGEFTEPLLQLEFVWIDQSGPCTDTVLVNFYRKPDANAGLDDAVCGNQYVFGAEFSIPESENYTPSGVWYYGSGPVGGMCDINAPYNNNSWVLVSGVGIWSFCRKEMNSLLPSCYSTDTVQIEFVEIPVISAGNDKDVCGPCTQMGAVGGWYNGSWLPAPGTIFEDYTDPNTEACVSVYGPKSFVWLESNSALTSTLSCTDKDTVVITFWREPTANILTDETDSTACGLTFYHLRAENPGTGIYGRWWNENPAVIFTPLNLETSVTVPSYGYYDFYWIEETGPLFMPDFCSDTAGPLTIHFLNEHPIFAGFDHDVFGFECELSGSSITETDPYADCNYLWICNNADIESNTSLQTNVTVSEYGIYEFILISHYVNMYSCTDADTVKINFRDPIYQGVENEISEVLKIFPNPAGDYISILSDKIINSVQIFDINGKLLKSVSDSFEDIDISGFEQGMYFVLIYTDDEVLKKKFVK